MPDTAAVQEWIRVHRMLMEREATFTDLALRAAAGEVSLEELNRQREVLMGMRSLCTAVYEKAFPKPV
jgi:hypothetical protein